MNIQLNGETHTTNAKNLQELLHEIELDEAVVATALNSEFIAVEERGAATLKEGDRVEILAPMQGG